MRLRISSVEKKIFILLIICASIPYIGFGLSIIKNSYMMVGSFSQNAANTEIYTNGMGRLFVYMKDILCVLLIMLEVFASRTKKQNKVLGFFCLLFLYGFFGLIINGNLSMGFLIAGIRTFMYVCVTVLFWSKVIDRFKKNKEYETLENLISKLFILITICLFVNLFFTSMQIEARNAWSSFGSGSYRFCGAFADSGNLGCYCISLSLFYTVVISDLKSIKATTYYVLETIVIFLAIASGTRTSMIICLLILILNSFVVICRHFRVNKFQILILSMSIVLLVLFPVSSYFTSWTDRGALEISGGGRLLLFLNMIDTSSIIQLIFGRGIGVGTNAAINLGLKGTNISDSTLNLIFTQFGLFGTIVFLLIILDFSKHLMKLGDKSSFISRLLFVITFVILFLVGNLFEQIAMVIILYTVYFLFEYENVLNCKNERIGGCRF